MLVARTEDRTIVPFYDNLRVDALETPITDLKETPALAAESDEQSLKRYEQAFEADDASGK